MIGNYFFKTENQRIADTERRYIGTKHCPRTFPPEKVACRPDLNKSCCKSQDYLDMLAAMPGGRNKAFLNYGDKYIGSKSLKVHA